MFPTLTRFVPATLIAGAFCISPVPPAVAQDPACLGPRDARRAVVDGRALPFAQVKRRVEGATGAEVVHARLCGSTDRLTYTLTVLHRGGQVVTMVVDASDGAYQRSEQIPRQPRADRREQVTGTIEP